MLLGQLGQLEGKQYLFMLNAKKASEKKLTLIKNRLEHRVFCFDFLSLLFRRFIKGWINGVQLDYANLANFGFFF